MFSVATWNINSVRLRIDQVIKFLDEKQPDILCLQEIKCQDGEFPYSAFEQNGYTYQLVLGMKSYNGVAIISKKPITKLESKEMCGKADARYIGARIGDGEKAISLHNFYVPAGGDIPDTDQNPKFAHKLDFLEEMKQFSQNVRIEDPRSILVGDLNVAPLEHDVWSHKQLLDVVSHTPVETEKLNEILSVGEWCDAFRKIYPEPQKLYTWWSYRSPDWEKANKGRRLDHIWLGRGISDALKTCEVHKETRGWDRSSDHAPLIAKIKMD